jgi:hypothetical protein
MQTIIEIKDLVKIFKDTGINSYLHEMPLITTEHKQCLFMCFMQCAGSTTDNERKHQTK